MPPVLVVYEGNDSGRATFDWVRGRKYLLFLFHRSHKRSWELDGCGNSGPVSGAGRALAEISAIKEAHGNGVIHGGVSEPVSFVPVRGVQVEAMRRGGQYKAITNPKGEFQISVPAGDYVLRARKVGFPFDKADFSYEDSAHIQIPPGGCAQVQLDAFEHRPTS